MKSARLSLKSWQKSLVYTLVWLVAVVGIKLLADNVLDSLLLHVAYVMIFAPLSTLLVTFFYTRKNGIKLWLVGYLTVSVLALYFFFGFNELSPNYLVENLICAFFGFGVGNIFKDEAAVTVQEDIDNERKKKAMEKERSYVPILKANPENGKKNNKGKGA
ncbi:MAG: hypothetical protein LUE12_03690 [Ruminococcus sp.]|nr:hypothetical protein [Ruminococcus sp.]